VRWILTKPRYRAGVASCAKVARAKGIPLDAPWKDLTEKARHFLLNGASGRFLGMLPFLQRLEAKRYKQYNPRLSAQYQLAKVCLPAAARGSSQKLWRSRRRPHDRACRGAFGRRVRDWIAALRADAVPARGGGAHPGGARVPRLVREPTSAGLYLTLDA